MVLENGPRWILPPKVAHGHEVVSIVVGSSSPKTFAIHKNLVVAASTFFDAALNGSFKEGRDQKITLPEDDSEAFQVFYDWLYTGKISTEDSTHTSSLYPDHFWLKVYRMADRLMIKGLQVIAYERFQTILPATAPILPSKEFIIDLFEDSEGTSPIALEMYVVSHVAYHIKKTSVDGWAPFELQDKWTQFLRVNERLGMEIAVRLATGGSCHPADSPSFPEEGGLGITQLRKDARMLSGQDSSTVSAGKSAPKLGKNEATPTLI